MWKWAGLLLACLLIPELLASSSKPKRNVLADRFHITGVRYTRMSYFGAMGSTVMISSSGQAVASDTINITRLWFTDSIAPPKGQIDLPHLMNKLWAAATLRDNLVTVLGFILHVPNNPLSYELHYTLTQIYDQLRHRIVAVTPLLAGVQQLSSLPPGEQVLFVFQQMKKYAPAYLQCAFNIWVKALTRKEVNIDSILQPNADDNLLDVLAGIPPKLFESISESVYFNQKVIKAASKEISASMGSLMAYIFAALQEGDLQLSQDLFAAIIVHRPLNLNLPHFMESERFLVDYLRVVDLKVWDDIIGSVTHKDMQTPVLLLRAILTVISEHDVGPYIRYIARFILPQIIELRTTASNYMYPLTAKIMTEPTMDIPYLLTAITTSDYPEPVVRLRDRVLYYIEHKHIDVDAVTSGFNRFDHTLPLFLLLGFLTRVPHKLPDLPQEILSTVKALQLYLIFRSLHNTFSPAISSAFMDIIALVPALKSPEMPKDIRELEAPLYQEMLDLNIKWPYDLENMPIEDCSEPVQCLMNLLITSWDLIPHKPKQDVIPKVIEAVQNNTKGNKFQKVQSPYQTTPFSIDTTEIYPERDREKPQKPQKIPKPRPSSLPDYYYPPAGHPGQSPGGGPSHPLEPINEPGEYYPPAGKPGKQPGGGPGHPSGPPGGPGDYYPPAGKPGKQPGGGPSHPSGPPGGPGEYYPPAGKPGKQPGGGPGHPSGPPREPGEYYPPGGHPGKQPGGGPGHPSGPPEGPGEYYPPGGHPGKQPGGGPSHPSGPPEGPGEYYPPAGKPGKQPGGGPGHPSGPPEGPGEYYPPGGHPGKQPGGGPGHPSGPPEGPGEYYPPGGHPGKQPGGGPGHPSGPPREPGDYHPPGGHPGKQPGGGPGHPSGPPEGPGEYYPPGGHPGKQPGGGPDHPSGPPEGPGEYYPPGGHPGKQPGGGPGHPSGPPREPGEYYPPGGHPGKQPGGGPSHPSGPPGGPGDYYPPAGKPGKQPGGGPGHPSGPPEGPGEYYPPGGHPGKQPGGGPSHPSGPPREPGEYYPPGGHPGKQPGGGPGHPSGPPREPGEYYPPGGHPGKQPGGGPGHPSGPPREPGEYYPPGGHPGKQPGGGPGHPSGPPREPGEYYPPGGHPGKQPGGGPGHPSGPPREPGEYYPPGGHPGKQPGGGPSHPSGPPREPGEYYPPGGHPGKQPGGGPGHPSGPPREPGEYYPPGGHPGKQPGGGPGHPSGPPEGPGEYYPPGGHPGKQPGGGPGHPSGPPREPGEYYPPGGHPGKQPGGGPSHPSGPPREPGEYYPPGGHPGKQPGGGPGHPSGPPEGPGEYYPPAGHPGQSPGGGPSHPSGPPGGPSYYYPPGGHPGQSPGGGPSHPFEPENEPSEYYPPGGHPGKQPGGGPASGIPGGFPGFPGFPGGSPGGIPGFPGGIPGFPGGLPGFPGGLPGFPGGIPGFPGGLPGFPGGLPGITGSPGSSVGIVEVPTWYEIPVELITFIHEIRPEHFPMIDRLDDSKKANRDKPWELIPVYPAGSPEEIALKPLRTFLSKPDLYAVLGPDFNPSLYPTRGELRIAILEASLRTKFVVANPQLQAIIIMYLNYLLNPLSPEVEYPPGTVPYPYGQTRLLFAEEPFPLISVAFWKEKPQVDHPEELIPRFPRGSVMDVKLRPIRAFLSQPKLYALLGSDFNPQSYHTKLDLLRAIIQTSLKITKVKQDYVLYYILSNFLMYLENPSMEREISSFLMLLKALPEPRGGKEKRMYFELANFLGTPNLLSLFDDTLKLTTFHTIGPSLKFLLKQALKVEVVTSNPKLLEAVQYYVDKVRMDGYGAHPIKWILHEVTYTQVTFDLADIFKSIDSTSLTPQAREAKNDIVKYLNSGFDPKQHFQGFNVRKYKTNGELLRGAFDWILAHDTVPSHIKTSIGLVLPYVRLTGPGAKAVNLNA